MEDIKKISPWFIAAVVMLPTGIEMLDTTVANVSLPYIAGGLAASVDESTWLLTSYIISNAVMLPITYWFSDKLGKKNYLLASVFVFTASSVMCGLSTSLSELIFFRILQGIGGGGLAPLSQAIMLESFPKEKHGEAMGFFGLGVLVAPIIGPYIGGWLSDNYSWHWIFFINFPLGVFSFYLIKYFIPESFNSNRNKKISMDYIGLLLLILFIGPMQIVLDKGQENDWFNSGFIIFFFIIMAVSFVCLLVWLLKGKNPIIDLKIFRDRNYALGTSALFIRGFIFYAYGVIYPLFLEKLLGYNATLSGKVCMYAGIGVIAVMPIAGWLTEKFNPKIIALTGVVLSCYGLWQIAGLNLNADFGTIILYRACVGIGSGLMFIPLNTIVYSFVGNTNITKCTGVANLARSIGGSIGISAATTLAVRRSDLHQTVLVNHTDTLTRQFNDYFNTVKSQLHTGDQTAYQFLYDKVLKQANLLAYLDIFKLLFILFIVTVPFILLTKTITKKQKKQNSISK
ncbi:MAG: DHA2 family efflux MFS transporter permease subunit [Victivallales bacterium]|nr:DHA2 family efflux MFS transporter permease subunit [Victivallales bacterium]MCF7888621.1 DHA2 family efflux MFS transporter permease subunit [Victivallales bacterium]